MTKRLSPGLSPYPSIRREPDGNRNGASAFIPWRGTGVGAGEGGSDGVSCKHAGITVAKKTRPGSAIKSTTQKVTRAIDEHRSYSVRCSATRSHGRQSH